MIDKLLADRGAIYGDFENIAETAQAIKRILRAGNSYDQLSMAERESLDMIASKLSRIVNGRHHPDNWLDVCGYSKLCDQ